MANKLLELYEKGKSLPVLHPGKYEVTLKKIEFVLNEKDENNSYFRVTMETTDTAKRAISTNKFDRGFQIMISHLKKQLGKEDEEVFIKAFLDDLIKKNTKFNIWVTTYEDPNTMRKQTNINFLEPIEPKKVEVVDDEDFDTVTKETEETAVVEDEELV